MKKICIIHSALGLGGGTASMIDLVNMLRNKYDVLPCISKEAKDIISYLKSENIPFYLFQNQIPTFNYYSGSSSLIMRSSFANLLKFCKESAYINEIESLKPDAVIFNSVVTCLSGRKLGNNIKNICFVRETFRRTKIDLIYKTVLDKYFQGVCFIAENERRYLNLKKTMTTVIPDCLQPHEIKLFNKEEACKIEGLNTHKFNILFMGGVNPIKGLDVALKAINILGDEYFLIIAGYFDQDKLKISSILKHFINVAYASFMLRTRKYYFKAMKNQNISCIGFRKDISSLFCACDVLIFPSNKVHQPRPGIEAGEYKKTIVISDYEATKEYFIDGYNAVVFKPHDAEDLADKLIKLKYCKTIRDILGNNNYKMTKEKHNYAETNIRLQKFIDKCIS